MWFVFTKVFSVENCCFDPPTAYVFCETKNDPSDKYKKNFRNTVVAKDRSAATEAELCAFTTLDSASFTQTD